MPHAFQQRLSFEKTPTLSYTLPSFHAVIRRWKQLQRERPETVSIIQPGLDKLDDYVNRILDIPAYTLAMSMFIVS